MTDRATKHLGHALVGLRNSPIAIHQKNCHTGRVQNLLEYGFALAQVSQQAVKAPDHLPNFIIVGNRKWLQWTNSLSHVGERLCGSQKRGQLAAQKPSTEHSCQ